MSLTIEIGNTSTALLTGVKNNLTEEVDDGANINITMYEKDGVTEVVGQAWPAPMYNEAGGTYGATLESDLGLKLNWTYIAHVRGIGTNGEVMDIRENVQAVSRGSAC